MYVEFHDRLGNPVRARCSRVLVTNDYGDPLALAVELGPDHVRAAHALDGAEFDRLLEESGVSRTTLVTAVPRSRLCRPEL